MQAYLSVRVVSTESITLRFPQRQKGCITASTGGPYLEVAVAVLVPCAYTSIDQSCPRTRPLSCPPGYPLQLPTSPRGSASRTSKRPSSPHSCRSSSRKEQVRLKPMRQGPPSQMISSRTRCGGRSTGKYKSYARRCRTAGRAWRMLGGIAC
jgi:hypothetical protein